MYFCELEEEEFQRFADQHPLKSFMQTKEMAHYQKMQKHDIYYVGVKKEQQILCATMMISSVTVSFKKVFYAPNGFLIDFSDTSLLLFFTKKIRKFIRKKKGYVLILEPYYPLKERDINGEIVKNGFDHSFLIKTLKKMGYYYKKTSSQVKYMFQLDLENKNEKEIFASMKTNTRSCIRKSLKEGIVFRELSYEELEVFKNLTSNSAKYHHFQDKSLEYYQQMYLLFHPKNLVKYVACEIHFDDYIKGNEKELKEVKEKMKKLKEKDGRRQDYIDRIKQLKKKMEEAEKLKKEKGNVLIISGAMFFLYGDEVVYLFSGNLKEYDHFCTAYRIQWEMIQYALKNNYKRYNFYGILSPTKQDSVYKFKKGFNGYVVELIGTFELPTHYFYYFRKIVYSIFR